MEGYNKKNEFFQSLIQAPLKYCDRVTLIEKNIDEIQEGSSQDENFLFFRKKENIRVYDKVCDHNGGKLSLKGENASCPLHGWNLDLRSGFYTNARCSKKPILEVNKYELDSPIISISKVSKELLTEKFEAENITEVRFLNHACLLFKLGKISFATDPWLSGSAFCNGWWLSKSSPKDAFDVINECDFIYISHNHPDHLHKDSLENIRKDMPILTADFLSGSTKNLIVDAGFTNIFAMDFISALVNSESEIFLSVLKSGDFRDDSGLFIQHGKFKCLLTVDSNLLNFGRFPRVDLLCSSFAGGASGFPLCFENYTELEKKAIIARNRGAIKATNSINIKSTKAKYFMPYAGFFVEKIERDHYIKKMNIKNTIEDYKKICISSRCELLNVNDNQYFTFKGSELIAKNIDLIKKMSIPDHSKNLIYNDQLVDKELLQKLFKYFQGCNFNDDLVVELIPTDGNFSNYSQRFTLDFKNNIYKKVDPSFDSKKIEIATLSTKLRYLQIKARKAELLDIIKKGKPWEDLSIGFQCRVYRMPNIYNSEFWFYFTNVYVGKSAATG